MEGKERGSDSCRLREKDALGNGVLCFASLGEKMRGNQFRAFQRSEMKDFGKRKWSREGGGACGPFARALFARSHA